MRRKQVHEIDIQVKWPSCVLPLCDSVTKSENTDFKIKIKSLKSFIDNPRTLFKPEEFENDDL